MFTKKTAHLTPIIITCSLFIASTALADDLIVNRTLYADDIRLGNWTSLITGGTENSGDIEIHDYNEGTIFQVEGASEANSWTSSVKFPLLSDCSLSVDVDGIVSCGTSITDTRCDTSGTCSQVCIGTDCQSSWLWQSGASGIYYNSGNVGIGTDNPGSYKLFVNGPTLVSGTLDVHLNEANANTVPYIDMYNDASGYVDWSLRKTGANNLTMYNAYSDPNFPVMTWKYVANGGNVGIGIAEPSGLLHIHDEIANGNASLLVDDGGDRIGLLVENLDSGTGMVIKRTGSVGINTESPDSNYKLSLNSAGMKITNTGSQPSLYIEDESGDATPFTLDADGVLTLGGDLNTEYQICLGGVCRPNWPTVEAGTPNLEEVLTSGSDASAFVGDTSFGGSLIVAGQIRAVDGGINNEHWMGLCDWDVCDDFNGTGLLHISGIGDTDGNNRAVGLWDDVYIARNLTVENDIFKNNGQLQDNRAVADFLRSTADSANSWIFHENATNWGLFHYNTDDGSVCANSLIVTRDDGDVGIDSSTCGQIPSGAEAAIYLRNETGGAYFAGNVGIGANPGDYKLYVLDQSKDVMFDVNNLYVNNPETTGDIVRLGSAWNKPGVYSNGNLYLGSEAAIIINDNNGGQWSFDGDVLTGADASTINLNGSSVYDTGSDLHLSPGAGTTYNDGNLTVAGNISAANFPTSFSINGPYIAKSWDGKGYVSKDTGQSKDSCFCALTRVAPKNNEDNDEFASCHLWRSIAFDGCSSDSWCLRAYTTGSDADVECSAYCMCW